MQEDEVGFEVHESNAVPPEPHTYEFQLIDPVTKKLSSEVAQGFLYVTSAFIGVGKGDGEVLYVVPLPNVYKVKQIAELAKPAGNA